MPLGIIEDIELDAQTVTIPEGGLLVIYSDGLTEALDANEGQFGTERLAKEIASISQFPAAHICSQLWKHVQDFMGEEPQSDDFTAIVIKRSLIAK
jgi:sigma-B regulation protein RsbU (phosphoserine phosphatase)